MIAVHDIDEIYRTAARTLGAGLLSVLCLGVGRRDWYCIEALYQR